MIYVYDTESDGFLEDATKFHCAVFKPLDGECIRLTTLDLSFLEDGDILVCHNQLGHDLPLMAELHNVSYCTIKGTLEGKSITFVDTLAWSRELNPDRELPAGVPKRVASHGLDAWSYRVNGSKPVIEQWIEPFGEGPEAVKKFREDVMERCVQDVLNNEKVFYALCKEGGVQINDALTIPFNLRLAGRSFGAMEKQARQGVLFDRRAAVALTEQIDKETTALKTRIEPLLPPRSPNKGELKGLTPPLKQFLITGEPSKACIKWFDEVKNIRGEWTGYYGGKSFKLPYHALVKTELVTELSNQTAIKAWLQSEGWEPTFWNYKKEKDKHGKARDMYVKGKKVKSSPKLQDKGCICPSLLLLGDKLPIVKGVIQYLSLRNRRSVIWNEEKGTGWLSNIRPDGRLSAGSAGLTNTKRQKHRGVVNVPRVGSILGEEMRACFIVPPGYKMVGYDASGLEARIEAHYTYRYDKVYAMSLLEGDVHSKNACMFYPEETKDWNVEDPCFDNTADGFEPYRTSAKSGKYALTYGSQPPTLALTLGVSLERAKEQYSSFWEGNSALRKLRDNLTAHWRANGCLFILGIDGSKVYTRSEHSLVNALFQSAGARVMDVAGTIAENEIKRKRLKSKRVLYVHDEYQYECPEREAAQIGEIGVMSVQKAGKILKLKVPLDADYKIGNTWRDTH